MRNSTLTTLRTRLKSVTLAVALMALPFAAGAAGLGKITVLSALGQPLRAEVDISASREELSSLTARVASAEAFKQAGIEFSSALTTIRLVIAKRADGQPYLSMLSDRPLSEPFLDLLVELNWNSGRLVREYTFLLDPPESPQKAPAAAPAISAPVAAAVPAAAPVAAAEPRRETPAAAQAPAPSQPEARPAPAPEEKPQPSQRPDMKVTRGADGAQRAAKAESAPAKQEPAQRLVKRGDTLSQIATETKPEGVNLDQMLVALFRGNQDAFVGNVNRLKAGKILAIPDSETAAGVDPDDAKKTVLAHAADFNAYSKKLAASVTSAASPKDEAPKRAVSGKIAPKVEDKVPPAAAGKDKLEVSKTELAPGGAGKAGAGRLAAIEETLIAREKALKDANSRIAELEKNLNDLKKLIELKSQGMAELQKQAQAAKPVATPPAPPPPAPEVKKPAAAAAPAVEKAAEKAAEKTVEKPVEKPAAAVPAAAPKPAPAPAVKKPATPPAPPPEPSFIDDSPEIVYGAGGILALLLAYFGYARWRKQRQSAAPVRAETSEPSSSSVMGGKAGATVDSDNLLSPTDFSSQSGMSGSDGGAGVDPVAEADVYLAYGRDVQAEEILLDALKTDPTRNAIHLKLLEIYAKRKSVKQFETIAGDLHKQTGGLGSDWEQAAKMGLQLDPANPLYAAATAFDPNATLVIAPGEQEIDLGDLGDLGITESPAEVAVPSPVVEAEPVVEIPATPPEELPASLDFELDLSSDLAPESAAATTPATGADELPAKFDIDLGLDAGAPADIVVDSDAVGEPSLESVPAALDMDFDLDAGAGEPAGAEPVSVAASQTPAAEDASAALDFNFDLDTAAPVAPDAAVAPEPEADSNTIDFDLEIPASSASSSVAPSVDLASINLDLGEPAAAEVSAAPEATQLPALDDAATQDVETKLELAQAYDEMGDKEGARELLQEVLNEGNAAQKETARGRLERLD